MFITAIREDHFTFPKNLKVFWEFRIPLVEKKIDDVDDHSSDCSTGIRQLASRFPVVFMGCGNPR